MLNRNTTNSRLLFGADNVRTLYDNFLYGMKVAGGPDVPLFGYRHKDLSLPSSQDTAHQEGSLSWITYGGFHDRFRSLSRGFQGLGLQPGDKVGLFADNKLEWALIEFATYYHGYISVAINDTIRRPYSESIIRLTELTTIFASTGCAKKLLEMRQQIPKVKNIVVMDAQPAQSLVDRLIENGFAVFTLSDVESYGRQVKDDSARYRPTGDDVATIVFTSGTTDEPKGVILTHANVVAAVAGANFNMDYRDLARLTPSDCAVIILPLSHILGRVCMHTAVATGCRVAFPRTNQPDRVFEDTSSIRPTVIFGVPPLLSRLQDSGGDAKAKGKGKSSSGLAGTLFRHAVRAKLRNIKHGGQGGHWLWDHVIFKPLSDTMGGRVRLIVAGSSAISREAMAFIKCAFSCEVTEGYGMTETCGAVASTTHDDSLLGSSGTPFPTCMVKLRSVPELGYRVDDKPYPRGEICVKGASVFGGYFRQPELTKACLDTDGWFYTGDLGLFDDQGRLKVIDRKSNIFKLNTGHVIEPERLEYVYCDCDLVTQAFVYGDREHGSLVGIVVLDPEFLRVFLVKKKIIKENDSPSHQMLCIDTRVRSAVMQELNSHGFDRNLSFYEMLSNVYLEPYGLDMVSLLTPTLKIKRHEAIRHYQVTINRLYDELAHNDPSAQGQMAAMISNSKQR